jgi:uncharacterized membrane protein
MSDAVAAPRGRLGWLMGGLALGALAVALYLGITKLTGGEPTCAVVGGCDRVNDSEYSTFLGIPVGLLGAAASAVTLVAALAWWRLSDRRALLVAYAVGLLSLPFLAWLTYLELFVIHAICIWCVTYAVLVIAGWLTASVVILRPASTET